MLGYESAVVNGQLIPVAPKQGFDPLVFGAAYTGQAMWPRQGVYNVPPILPSAAMQASMAPTTFGATGTYPYPSPTDEHGSPFSIKKSPLWWALGFLIIGLAMLHYIHYR